MSAVIPGLEERAESKRWTAKDLIEALRRHHEPPPSKPIGGYFVDEIQAPNSTRRADALWLPVNSAARGQITGYETKVTRADVVQELRDPMKADAWQKYCDYWYLVIPNGSIIDGLDIPDSWGIMQPPMQAGRRTMTVVRKAPRLNPVDPRDAFGTILAKLVYGGADVQSRITTAQANAAHWENQVRALGEEVRGLRQLAQSESSSGRLSIGSVLTEVSRLIDTSGAWLSTLDLDASAVAKAIVTECEARDAQERADRAIDTAIRETKRRLDELEKVRTAVAA